MYKLCVFAGTSEGRELVGWLSCQKNVSVTACAATEYGGELLEEIPGVRVSARRLDEDQMRELFRKEGFSYVVDATHPYAPIVTENIRAACRETGVPYLRLLRDGGLPENCVFVSSTQEAVRWLSAAEGNIFLTVGSKELAAYKDVPGFGDRVYARVLPVESSLAACREAGLPTARTIAMQGPFSEELNIAMLKSANAQVLVTKQTGSKGGFWEKAEAARKTGVTLLVIGRPDRVEGLSFSQTAAVLCRELNLRQTPQVTVVGIGPGDRSHRTLAAANAISQADCLIGARRMLQSVAAPGQTWEEAIAPEKIVEAIEKHPECRRFAVVMAGDIGFYSGAKKLLPLLGGCKVTLEPGLSSLVCLCAKLGTSYEDVVNVSLHGRDGDILSALRKNKRVFVLVGGENGMGKLAKELTQGGFGDLKLSVGERLCYPDEKITVGTAAELSEKTFDSLSVVLIEGGGRGTVTHGLPDETFQRGSHENGTPVPMTKREVRACALSHLGLTRDALCWDIGAGTGSVAIEMALQADLGHVYAIEKKPEALALLEENARHLGVSNLTPVSGLAPDSCADLPAPTHVFIGGSSGKLEELLKLVWKKNPGARIVATAVALETVGELARLCKLYGGEGVCLTAAQARSVGNYTLMQGQNPIYLFTFPGRENHEV